MLGLSVTTVIMGGLLFAVDRKIKAFNNIVRALYTIVIKIPLTSNYPDGLLPVRA